MSAASSNSPPSPITSSETEERLTELVDCLVELGQRLDTLEAIAVENAGDGGDPLTRILARLDAFDNRLTRLERHLRRPPPFPITVVENVDSRRGVSVNEVSYEPVSPPNDTSANAVIMICVKRSRTRWPRSISASTDAPTNFAGCASVWRRSRRGRRTKEPRHEGCLLAD